MECAFQCALAIRSNKRGAGEGRGSGASCELLLSPACGNRKRQRQMQQWRLTSESNGNHCRLPPPKVRTSMKISMGRSMQPRYRSMIGSSFHNCGAGARAGA